MKVTVECIGLEKHPQPNAEDLHVAKLEVVGGAKSGSLILVLGPGDDGYLTIEDGHKYTLTVEE